MNSTLLHASPALSSDELALYHRQGWIVKRGIVSPQDMVAVDAEIEGLHERMAAATAAGDGEHSPEGAYVTWEEGLANGKKRIRQLMNSERVSPMLDLISRSEDVLAVLRQLIGPDIYLFHSKLMMKAANDGSFTPWHQDFQYWQYESKEPTQVNCMLAIDGSDAANGALRFVDGSHHQGLIPAKRFATRGFSIGIEGGLDAFPEATMVTMEPGDAVFFGPLVIHGSGPNTSSRHRRANTFAFDKPGNRLKGELADANWRCGRRVG